MITGNITCAEFVESLASNSPTPGGGGAAAVMGALAAALAGMVASLTLGKKKYDGVQREIIELKDRCNTLQTGLLRLADDDAAAFGPLAEGYRMPSDTETQKTEKEHAIQHALTRACAVPLEIMDMCGSAVECAEAAAQTGSRLAVSDAGCAALCASAALECAALNVFINTRIMTDREAAKLADARANELLAKYRPLAGGVVESVRSQLTKPAFTKEQ